jgi:signal recognition particle receptor subunit beta
MASLNPLTREVVFKIVFYGPGLGGKTTTLQHIHAASKPEHRGKMVSLATPMDRTLYFDFLPLRMPLLHGMHVRLQLFTVPGQVYFGATRKLVLTGADGVVFVADSQVGRQDANHEALEDLVMNLAENNLALLNLPHTFHWNKRDIPDVVPIPELDRTLNRQGAPSLGTIATTGEGVFTGLERIARLVFQAYESELPKSDPAAVERPSGERPAIEETTIADALRGLAEAPMRSRATPPDAVAAPKSTGGASRGAAAGAAPVSSLESIPNPIPRRPTGSFEGTQASAAAAPASSAPASAPSSKLTPAPAPAPSRPSIAQVPPWQPNEVPTQVRAASPTPSRGVAPQAAHAVPSAHGAAAPSHAEAVPESAKSSRAWAEDPVPSAVPATQHAAMRQFSFAALWPDAEREGPQKVEQALAAGDTAGALVACDAIVTRLLTSASPSAPDLGLTVLLLGIDGRRYLAFRACVQSAKAREPVSLFAALEAYAFAVEVRRARALAGGR